MLIEKVLHPEYEERNENANRFTGAYGWIKCMVAICIDKIVSKTRIRSS